jgi:hypothetical protein
MKTQNPIVEKISNECKTSKPLNQRAVKMLANSIYDALRQEGCEHKDIIGVSSQLIGLVTTAIDEKKD